MNTCPCPACSAPSGLALLHGEILDVFHECVGGDRPALEIGPPIGWAGRQDHILTLLANEHFARAELELFRQPHGLTAIVHEHLGSSLHGRIPPWIYAVYISICHGRLSGGERDDCDSRQDCSRRAPSAPPAPRTQRSWQETGDALRTWRQP